MSALFSPSWLFVNSVCGDEMRCLWELVFIVGLKPYVTKKMMMISITVDATVAVSASSALMMMIEEDDDVDDRETQLMLGRLQGLESASALFTEREIEKREGYGLGVGVGAGYDEMGYGLSRGLWKFPEVSETRAYNGGNVVGYVGHG